jgi:hypothetical protein
MPSLWHLDEWAAAREVQQKDQEMQLQRTYGYHLNGQEGWFYCIGDQV